MILQYNKLYCSDIAVVEIISLTLLNAHFNVLLPSQFTLLLSNVFLFTEERHHHGNTAFTSSGFLHMSDSVTVTTCFMMKFQHRGAPHILIKNIHSGV